MSVPKSSALARGEVSVSARRAPPRRNNRLVIFGNLPTFVQHMSRFVHARSTDRQEFVPARFANPRTLRRGGAKRLRGVGRGDLDGEWTRGGGGRLKRRAGRRAEGCG